MNDISGDHLMTEDRDAVRRLIRQLPDLIRMAETCGAVETKQILELAQEEARRILAQVGGDYDH